MIGANETLPRTRIGHVGREHLTIEAGRLIEVVCLLQQPGILQLRLDLQSVRSLREGHIER